MMHADGEGPAARAPNREVAMNAKMANWMAGVVLPALLVMGWALDGVASSWTSAEVQRPVSLWRETDVGVVRHLAASSEGEGVPFGYRARFELGPAGAVECVGRFAHYRCADGWRIEPLLDSL
jgi:hypothetical protein